VGNGLKCYTFPKIRAVPKSNITIGKNVTFGFNCTLEITENGKLIIGDGVNITQNVLLSSTDQIKIGANCLIGENVSIRDSDHGVAKDELVQHQNMVAEKIQIENDVWIGGNVVVLKGSHLKEGVVIGANSLVLKSSIVEPYGIYGGSPIKKIKERG
jgi:acetyltransferase-like isoleucine patch superfamily enzyme